MKFYFSILYETINERFAMLGKVLAKNKKVQNFRFHPTVVDMLNEYIQSEKKKGVAISKNSFLEELLYERLKEVLRSEK